MKRLEEKLSEVDVTPQGISYNHPTGSSRRSFVKACGAAAALASLGHVSSRLPPVYAKENKVTALTSMYPVTIDGKWTNAEEWTDQPYDITAPGNVWKVKHDSDSILTLFDYIDDTQLNAFADPTRCDVATVRIDTMKNGGIKPQPDDYAFLVNWLSPDQPTLVMQQGTGNGWNDVPPLPSFSAASSMDASNDPYSAQPHMIYEFKIPKSILPPDTSSVNCRLGIRDGNKNIFYAWPKGSDRDNPNTWGELELSENVIPEFSSAFLPLTLALGIPLYVLKRYSKRREEIQSLNNKQH